MRWYRFLFTSLAVLSVASLNAAAREYGPGEGPIRPLPGGNRGLNIFYSITGPVSYSVDAVGSRETSHLIQVEKPSPNATVLRADLMAASILYGAIPDGTIVLEGTPLSWDEEVLGVLGIRTYRTDVTSLIAPLIDPAPAGVIDLTISEGSTADNIDGEVLVVVFDDPAVTRDHTVALAFGAQDVNGDTFTIGLADPVDPTEPGATATMGLGISFSVTDAQYSLVDVQGVRVSSAAGGPDDGACFENGCLITCGGIGDSIDNPADPSSHGDFDDDELYNLLPFIDASTTTITVDTLNPSDDDNIFFAHFYFSAPAIVEQAITLAPPAAQNPVDTDHTLTAHVEDDTGTPVVGTEVTFEVIAGPNAGDSGSDFTDAQGDATWTYTGDGGAGTDQLQAYFLDNQGQRVNSNIATKTWVQAPPPPPPPVTQERVSTSEKGSVLVFPKVELRWNAAGDLIQDTFISLSNDFNQDVWVLMYYVSETCTVTMNDIVLTHNEPAYWSAATGQPKGVSPFSALVAPYPDPDGSSDLVSRGALVVWAINNSHEPIDWNHLYGDATIMHYGDDTAWEYSAYAFQSLGADLDTGDVVTTEGELLLDGIMYDNAFSRLLLNFIASGSTAFSGAGHTIDHDTDVTLMIADLDLRQDNQGPPITKAKYYIWNEEEVSFAQEYCVTKWSERLLSLLGGHFLVGNLQTDKGRARIEGMGSTVCPGSADHALLGTAAKFITVDAVDPGASGLSLAGTGTEAATILYDIPGGPGESPGGANPDGASRRLP